MYFCMSLRVTLLTKVFGQACGTKFEQHVKDCNRIRQVPSAWIAAEYRMESLTAFPTAIVGTNPTENQCGFDNFPMLIY
jgi:hypothetical protein